MKTRACAFVLAGVAGMALNAHDVSAASWDRRGRRMRSAIQDISEKSKPAEKDATTKRTINGVPVESIEDTLYVPPKPNNLEPPVYPFEMLKERVRGEASVSCLVDTDGRVVQINVLNATRPEFAEALAAAIEAADFAYGTREGDPIASVLGFRYRFEPRAEEDDLEKKEDLELLDKAVKKRLAVGKPGELDRPLRAKKQPSPAFPVKMLKSGAQGAAVIEFYLDQYGDARLPRVLSATDPAFGYAAAHAVAQWRFEPATIDGEPVVLRVSVPINFRLQ